MSKLSDTLLRQAAELETALAAATVDAAKTVVPPFTQRQRQTILAAFQPCMQLRAQIHLTLSPLLRAPELHHLRPTDPIRQALDGFTRHLTHWAQAYRVLEQVIRAPKIALPALLPAIDSPVARQLLAFDGLLHHLHYHLGPAQNNEGLLQGHHDDIPMAFTRFLQLAQFGRRLAQAVGRTAPLSFLDVGCGISLKVLGAAQFFETAHGLDYDQPRAAIAHSLVAHKNRPNDRAFAADGITFDGYGRYDVIYAYQPMSDETLQIQMDRHIAATARPGTVLIMPHVQFQYRYADYGCHPVAGPVYLTGYTAETLKPVLRRLANIGHIMPKATTSQHADQALAAPLCDALRAWGHLE